MWGSTPHPLSLIRSNMKLYYTTLGFLFTALNVYLIDTRFTIIGIGFGIAGGLFFIQALRTKL
jgi:hypothetical protein